MADADVQLRRIPYPYRAMLAICSDLDETPERHTYLEIARFLNTTDETAMGPGVGLEVGNTIYFDMPPDQFAYGNTDDAGREMVRTLIRSGHVDCLHSYGDLATSRAHAGRALEDLNRHGCRLHVWVDHGQAVTNFGSDIMEGHGDEPGHEAYHADLTTQFGVRYVWRGRVTSVLGQEIPAHLGGIWTGRHPLASARTLSKELAKQILARRGHPKYAIHAANRVLRPVDLRDGCPVQEFLRCNPHWGGVSCGDTARGIGGLLTRDMLDRLVRRQGVCILYTHLGKCHHPRLPFGPEAVAGFRRLAGAYRSGSILVCTTRRLLDYAAATSLITWSVQRRDGLTTIAVRTGSESRRTIPLQDLAGLTFYTDKRTSYQVEVDGEICATRENPPDDTGRPSLMIEWSRLEFPPM